MAIARGTDQGELALGGADVILSTITNAGAMAAAFGGLRPHGTLLVVGADMDPIAVPAAAFIAGGTGLRGHASGTARDSEDTLAFSILQGVKPMIETLPLLRVAEAYEKMTSGDARFRMVLTTGA